MSNIILTLLILLLCSIVLVEIRGGHIVVSDPADVSGTSYVDMFLTSYPIAVGGNRPAFEIFGNHSDLLKSIITKGKGYMDGGEPRGIPPSNWAKIAKPDGSGHVAFFNYKSIHRCQQKAMVGSSIVDSINVVELRIKFNNEPEFYMSRTAVAERISIHSVTTPAKEIYVVKKVIDRFTDNQGAHSDVRIIPFKRECKYLSNGPGLKDAHYVAAGSLHDRHWQEKQFLSVLDNEYNVVASWVLRDPETAKSLTRPQKNWLPFWDKCKLILSKRFGPEHVVGEFNEWKSKDKEIDIPNLITSPSPARVPNPYMIRGSAPPVHHPLLDADYAIGCVHLRGKLKVYRHSLYVVETKYPYNIVSYSPLFSFKPYRDIEFVMSLNPLPDGSLELTHGSMDCEPRIAIFNRTYIEENFKAYLKLSFD